jgi:xanthosine utilization system XapX-like protein
LKKPLIIGIFYLIFVVGIHAQAQTKTESAVWYAGLNNHVTGPYSIEDLKLLIQKGELTKSTPLWKEGIPGWIEAGTIGEIVSLFDLPFESPISPVPPPLVAEPEQAVPSGARSLPQPASGSQMKLVSAGSDYTDFSTGRRVAAGFTNIFLGLGSYTMGDGLGGLVITVGEGCGIAVIVVYAALNMDPLASNTSAYLFGTGIGLVVGNVIAGFIRPFLFHRPRASAAVNDSEGWNIAFIPGKKGIDGVKLSYTFSFKKYIKEG